MPSLGEAKGKLTVDTSDVTAARGRVKREADAMNKALNAIGVGFGLEAVRRLGDMAFQLAETAAKAQVTRESFANMAETVNSSADAMLQAMRRASKGTISDTNLMLGANRALISGVADSSADLTQLLEISRATAKNFGIDTSDAFNRIVLSLSKLEPELIDEIGITVRLDKVFRDYAKSVGTTAENLTDAQRKAAFFNQVVKQTQKLVDANAGAADSAADKFAQLSARLENTKVELGEFLLAAGATDSLDTFGTALEDSIDDLERFDNWLRQIKRDWDAFVNSASLGGVFAEIKRQNDELQTNIARFGILIGARQPFGTAENISRDIGRHGRGGILKTRAGSGSSLGDTPAAVNTKLLDAQRDYAKELQEINRDSARQIAGITRDGARQRAETIRQYEQEIAREAEDFARQRARSQRDYEASVLDVARDAAEREAEMQEDLQRTIARARQDSNERIAELEEEYAKSRARREEDHRDKLLSAAGRLDAIAILEERKRFARETRDAEEAHDEQIEDERETLQESIDQAEEAHREQLDDARKADRQRLEDMRAAREQQLADEDEERRIQRERAAEDHRHQLEQMDIAQAEHIQQIIDNAAEDRRVLDEAHAEELYDLGEHTFIMGEKRREQYKLEKQIHDEFMAELRRESMEAIRALPRSHPSEADPYLERTTPTGARATSSGSRSVNVHPGAIVIHGDGLNEQQVANLVVDYLERL